MELSAVEIWRTEIITPRPVANIGVLMHQRIVEFAALFRGRPCRGNVHRKAAEPALRLIVARRIPLRFSAQHAIAGLRQWRERIGRRADRRSGIGSDAPVRHRRHPIIGASIVCSVWGAPWVVVFPCQFARLSP